MRKRRLLVLEKGHSILVFPTGQVTGPENITLYDNATHKTTQLIKGIVPAQYVWIQNIMYEIICVCETSLMPSLFIVHRERRLRYETNVKYRF